MSQSKTKKTLQLTDEKKYEVVEEVSSVKHKESNKFSTLAQVSELGFVIAIPISLGALIGVWLDGKWNSHPKMTLSLLFVGIFLAFGNLMYIVKIFSKKTKKT